MKAILPDFSDNSAEPLYIQLYSYIRDAILSKEIVSGEKLPSLRNLSESLSLSLTTVETAYNQLAVEGYIYSKPKSGFYVRTMSYPGIASEPSGPPPADHAFVHREQNYLFDLSCFDFNKWKKCVNRILTDHPERLLFEGDPQGEPALRYEISKYVFQSRGVRCKPDQVVIAAGTQQITAHLSRIFKEMAIGHVALEEPGYLPVRNIFHDSGFAITPVEVKQDGITIEKLPGNISSAVYVNPSNQFPTGAIMPVGRRYQLLSWAERNNSFIVEDDYDSELRYFGNPIPALQGLDSRQRVIYLGSFSSTLFSAIKISFMVLPEEMLPIFNAIKDDYAQTCSKTEQLTLALFMEKGYYQTGLKKLRRLYAQKWAAVVDILSSSPYVTTTGSPSGINMIISVHTKKTADELCREAISLGIFATPALTNAPRDEEVALVLYYNKLPLSDIRNVLLELLAVWGGE
ncbi:MAG: PLP-dependent aminotransferase family protein [Anaerovoracaceae bacterium]|jgi:GntR family transcriptional regulator/MocR family aminotransferase